MDEIRARCGLSLKRIYQLYPSKEHLVLAFLRRRDVRWRGQLATYVERTAQPGSRIWPCSTGCTNGFPTPTSVAVPGSTFTANWAQTTPVVAAAVREHKQTLALHCFQWVT